MLKRSTVLALGLASFTALSLSHPAVAANMNGTANGMLNGTLNGTLNGMLNGTLNGTLNGNSPSGHMFDVATLQAVKLALPDGTELLFR